MKVQKVKLQLNTPGPLQGTLSSTQPQVSWQVVGDETNWFQREYQIKLRYGDDSEWEEFPPIKSENSQFVAWPGRSLKSRESFEICVRVLGDGTFSDWSAPVEGQVGFLSSMEEWPAKFVAAANQPRCDSSTAPETLFRKQFSISKEVKHARLWSTALGIYNVEINGNSAGKDYLSPGWTTYEKRLLHQMYDVTHLVKVGENAIGVRVGPGWYSGLVGFDGGLTNIYGEKRAISLFLEIKFDDDSTLQVSTDDTWTSSAGPIIAVGLYDGETYDANEEIEGWSLPGTKQFEDWQGVDIIPFDTSKIVPQEFPHVTKRRLIKAEILPITPCGKKILDFGENIVGFLSFKNVTGPKGYKASFMFAEVMENGELGIRPLRAAKATDTYVFKGEESGELYEPHFTFHGFRYCQIDDPENLISLENLEAIVISTAMNQIGEFECDNDLLNQLHSNVIRSTVGNFITLPTDCPQRDERMGWTGDIAIFGNTASFLFDCSPMLNNWLKDLWSEQQLNAKSKYPYSPPVTVPNMIKYAKHFWDNQISAIWQDCAVYLPKALFDSTGSTFILKQQYESMEKWINCIPKVPGEVRWNKEKVQIQLGDWLDPLAPPDDPLKAMTDSYLVADSFLCLVLSFMVEISSIVSPQDTEKYIEMARMSKRSFQKNYILPTGQMTSDTQTAYALAISFDLFEFPEQVQYAGNRLSQIVRSNDFKISTGFAGTPFVTLALVVTGHLEDAYGMLLQTKCPSWLYPITMGATTIWERWNSMMPDGSINPGDMTSFNHYALGSVANTLHEIVGGLSVGEAGYKKFKIHPQPGGGIKFCQVAHESPYGKISSTWNIAESVFRLKVAIPLNTSAEVILPDGSVIKVESGSHEFECRI